MIVKRMGIQRRITFSKKQSVYLMSSKSRRFQFSDYSAIVRTLNATYHNQSYGIGNTHTTYPVSAFITDLVYLKDTEVDIDVKQINVRAG
jgi:hypothetical protein